RSKTGLFDSLGQVVAFLLRNWGILPQFPVPPSERCRKICEQLVSDSLKIAYRIPMRRVLVVADEEYPRLVLKTFLRRNDYEVEVAEDGEEALPMTDGFGPDFVITDVRMPRMGGMDLLAALEAKQSSATVIVMSAYGSHDMALDAIAAGAYD